MSKDVIGLPLDSIVPNTIQYHVRVIGMAICAKAEGTRSRGLKGSNHMRDDELLGVLASLGTWKQDIPKYERYSQQNIPMLTPDRFLKGYYMVRSVSWLSSMTDSDRH